MVRLILTALLIFFFISCEKQATPKLPITIEPLVLAPLADQTIYINQATPSTVVVISGGPPATASCSSSTFSISSSDPTIQTS